MLKRLFRQERKREEDIEHLKNVFTKLEKANLKLKRNKCLFMKTEITYLGHLLNGRGISIDKEKIDFIRKLPRPKNVKQVKRFLGMVNYHRNFIKNFSEIALPITKLTSKREKFSWNDEHQCAFDNIQEKLASADVLGVPVKVNDK